VFLFGTCYPSKLVWSSSKWEREMPTALFLYRNHDNDGDDDDDDDDGDVNYSHHPSSKHRRGVDDMSYTGSSKSGSAKKKSGNKQFNGYQTIINSDIRQYGGQYLLQSSNHSSGSGGSKGGSGMKARRGNASLVVSEDLVRSNQIKRRIRWV
jgi:hypothetical protein